MFIHRVMFIALTTVDNLHVHQPVAFHLSNQHRSAYKMKTKHNYYKNYYTNVGTKTYNTKSNSMAVHTSGGESSGTV